MFEFAIVDTSALLASIVREDLAHASVASVFRRRGLSFVPPSLLVAETAYTVGERFGAVAEPGFIRRLRAWTIETPSPDEWLRVAELIERDQDVPLGATDASVVVLAEWYRTDLLVTLDRRHFAVVRPNHVESFRILPE